MPETRARKAAEAARDINNQQVPANNDGAPANPIAERPDRRDLATALEPDAGAAAAAPSNIDREQDDRRSLVGSVRTTASAAATRIRQAELAAEERLYVLEKQMIQKRLAAEVANIQMEADPDSLPEEHVNVRLKEWVEEARRETTFTTPRDTTQRDLPGRRGEPRRHRSPTPGRGRDRGIDRLADALERMMRTRAPPRQTTDLPIFNGSPGEWLPFKAAMEETTATYNFTPSENLARLRSCLRGEAREAVTALLFTAADPAVIMKTLQQSFGRPEVLIDRAMEDLKRLPAIKQQTSTELNNIAIKVQNIVTTLKVVDTRGFINNPMMTRTVLDKLTPHLKSRWCDYADEHCHFSEPEIVTLSKFLMREADRAVRFAFTSPGSAAAPAPTQAASTSQRRGPANAPAVSWPQRRQQQRGAAVYATEAKTAGPSVSVKPPPAPAPLTEVCLCCGSNHLTPQCGKLKRLSVSQRWDWAREANVCFLCLIRTHRRFRCTAKRCTINGCAQAHHILLHGLQTVEDSPPKKEESTEDDAVTASAHTGAEVHTALLKVCAITVEGPEGSRDVYALLDEGSTVTLIDRDVADAVGARGPKCALNIHGATSSSREPDSAIVPLRVRGASGEAHDIKARTVNGLMLGQQAVPASMLRFPHLSDLPPAGLAYAQARPQVLIGADNWHLIVTRELRCGRIEEPAASRTRLGWVLHGAAPPATVTARAGARILHMVHADDPRRRGDDALDELVRGYFSVDALGVSARVKTSREDQRAIDVFNETVRLRDGHFEVGLPWKAGVDELPPSYDMATRRLHSIEKKMDRNPAFAQAYRNQVKNLFDKGYAEPADGTACAREWYLPHFAVTNPNKPGKLRLVFDAAATARGMCLNDALLAGPDMLQPLPGIIWRFREHQVAITTDIREMFLQINIREADRPAQRFLWRDEDGTIKRYQMKAMIFGAKSSPFLAHSVRNRNAEDCRDTHPIAYKAITDSHYMDDWVQSFESRDAAVEAIKQVRYVHNRAHFSLAGWNSNIPELLRDIPNGESTATTGPRELGMQGAQEGKALGLLWLAETDELAFNTRMPRVPEEVRSGNRDPTKRETLAAVMSIFDPLGFLGPFTIKAKIILQLLWREKLGWDEPLPTEAATNFQNWIRELQTVISKLTIPRCYNPKEGKIHERQLHIFVDASEEAYAAAAYWRFENTEGVTVQLAAGKAKVAPLKQLSIPRLELQAALIGVRLAAAVKEGHRWQGKTLYWTDSKTVYQWITSDSAKHPSFVAHRLGEIDEMTERSNWRWVPSRLNVADDATRTKSEPLTQNSRWFRGPDFLREAEVSWPIDERAPEQVNCAKVFEERMNYTIIEIDRFSNYSRLKRATAYVLLFIEQLKTRLRINLATRHLKEAERILIRQAQIESFPIEYSKLKNNEVIPKNSKLYKLDVQLDNELIKLRGRVNAAPQVISDSSRAPPVLDGRHHLTRLLIRGEHEKGHIGGEHLVNNVRQLYWVLRLRVTTRAVCHSCVICKARKGVPTVPVKGDLPAARLAAYSKPFSRCGVDCFGPMVVTIGRRHEKRWGLLFTCLVTRAIHIELLSGLSTESAIMGLRRMAARRGWPAEMWSDNGTNFRGADAELRAAYAEWLPALRDYGLGRQMSWRFIDPGAPNQGGPWERLIRSVKTAMTVVLRERAPKEEVLATVMAEVENIVNSRPLTHVSTSPSDNEALTPNHFLLGSSSGLPLVGPCELADRRTWRAAQALADSFWARWVREYLPTLTPRGDVRRTTRQPRVGDLVIIADGTLPRNVWPRGVIQATYPGPDGEIRSADVHTKGGTFRRPVRRLVVLPAVTEGFDDALRRGETVGDNSSGPKCT